MVELRNKRYHFRLDSTPNFKIRLNSCHPQANNTLVEERHVADPVPKVSIILISGNAPMLSKKRSEYRKGEFLTAGALCVA